MADPTDCDREPIHIPGTIQPFGVLLVLTEPTLTVAQVSENVDNYLPLDAAGALGRPLSSVIDPSSVEEVRESLCDQRWLDVNPLHISAHGRQFDGIVHRHDGAAILELEPNPDPPTSMHHPFRGALFRIQRVTTLPELADVVVQQMRHVTGFERVMFYRFHEDGHGSVDAEAREPGLEPYLGLHYPASDIPAQARHLYLKNWLRLIFDARATPARVVPSRRIDTGAPLDLSLSVLRSVSPIHLEYMVNMGVRASMSISLIVRDRLWGLISCLNHTGPRRVSQEIRSGCEFVGRLTSLIIPALEDRGLVSRRTSRRATEDALARAMRESTVDDQLRAVLLAYPKELMGLVGAAGAAVVSSGDAVTCGLTPPPALIEDIAAWAEEQEAFSQFCTASLGVAFPRAKEASDVASGLLTFALPGAPSRRLLWFRPEIIQTVSWGGDPTKPVSMPPGDRLRPRNSFTVWREEVRLRSHPWTTSDLEAADELQRRAIEVDLERRLLGEQRAVRARDELIAVVSHDLKTPLSNILLQATIMSRAAAGDDESSRQWCAGAERIRRAASHMSALTEDLLDLARIEAQRFTLDLQPIETLDLVTEAVQVAAPAAEAKQITIAMDLIDSPRLQADPERLFRVLCNLLGNAIKFTPKSGAVTVRAERRGDELWTTVVDNGPGIPADQLPHIFDRYWKARPAANQVGAGLGLYISKGIVEAHGGRIWAESSAGGARLSFAIPLSR